MSQEGDNRVIEIEGILRGGSDLDCVDGACNEVIGLEHENGYMRPYTPKDLGIQLTGFVRLFVHKTQTQSNYILIDATNKIWWISEAEVETHKGEPNWQTWLQENKRSIGISVKSAEVQMVALGNLVAIDCLDVILFNEGRYSISVRGGAVDFCAKVGLKKNGFLMCQSQDAPRDNNGYVNIARMNAVSQSKKLAMEKGSIVGLCYMRYGLKLYDGSYTSLSSPVLVSDADYSEVLKNYNTLNTEEKKGGLPLYFDDWIESMRFRYQQRGEYKASNDVLGMRWGVNNAGDVDGSTPETKAQYGMRSSKDETLTPFTIGFYEQKIQFRTSRGELNKRDYPSLSSSSDVCVVEDMDDGGIGWDSIWKAFAYLGDIHKKSTDLGGRSVSQAPYRLSDDSYPLPVYAASTAGSNSDAMYNSFAMRLMNCPTIKIEKALSEELENYVLSLDIMITKPVDYIKTPTSDDIGGYGGYYNRLPRLKDLTEVKEELRKNMDMFYVLESIPFSQLKNMKENKSGSVYSIGIKNVDISTITSSESVPLTPSNSGLRTRYNVSYLYNNRLHIAGISSEYKAGAYGGITEMGTNYLNNYLNSIFNTYSQYDTPTRGTETESENSKRNPYRFMEIRSDTETGNGKKETGEIYWDNALCKNSIGSMPGVVTTGAPFSLGESFDDTVVEMYKKGDDELYRWIKNNRISQELIGSSEPFMIQDGVQKQVATSGALGRLVFNSQENVAKRASNLASVNGIKAKFGFSANDVVNEEMLALVRFDINESEGTSAARNIKTQYDIISLSLFNDRLFRSYISPVRGLEKFTIESICMMSLTEEKVGNETKGYKIGDVRSIRVNSEFTMVKNSNASSNAVYYISDDFSYVTISGLTDGKTSKKTSLTEFFYKMFSSIDTLSVSGNTFEVSNVNSLTAFDEINTYTAGRGTIIGFASNANDVSTAQFGQFPLYVFTTEGVFAFRINTRPDEGDQTEKVVYGDSVPISRDVCNNRNSICETSKIVLFSSDRGLMLLHGSEVECISEMVNGSPAKFLPHETAEDVGDGLNVYSRAISDSRLVLGTPYLSEGECADFKDFLSNEDTHLVYMYEKDKVVAYNKKYEYSYLIDVVDTKSCYVTKIPSQTINHTDNYPDTMVLIKQDPVVVRVGTRTGWIEYDEPQVEVEQVTYNSESVDTSEYGHLSTEGEAQESYEETKLVSISKEILCAPGGEIQAKEGEEYTFNIALKIESKPVLSAMYYGEESEQWSKGEGDFSDDEEATVNVEEQIAGVLDVRVVRTPVEEEGEEGEEGEEVVVLHETEQISEIIHTNTETIEGWRWRGEEIILDDDNPERPIDIDSRYSVFNIINKCQEGEEIILDDDNPERTIDINSRYSIFSIINECQENVARVILNVVDYSLHSDFPDATVRISVAGRDTTIVYDQSPINPRDWTVGDGGYVVFEDQNASGEWEISKVGNVARVILNRPNLSAATVRISVEGGNRNTTIVYDQSQIDPGIKKVEDGGYIVFDDPNASGEWEISEGKDEDKEPLSVERTYEFTFSVDRAYRYRIEIGGLEYSATSSYTRTPAGSEDDDAMQSSRYGSVLTTRLTCNMDYETEHTIYGEYTEVEMFEEVEPIALSQFTYDGEDVAQKVVLQTRPIKMTNALMKQAFRVVVRGDFAISDETPEGSEGHKRLGLYIMASNDTKKWMYIGGTEHEYNGYPMTDIGTTVERFTYKYLMIVLSGELARESYIKSIELSSQYKYNKKLR